MNKLKTLLRDWWYGVEYGQPDVYLMGFQCYYEGGIKQFWIFRLFYIPWQALLSKYYYCQPLGRWCCDKFGHSNLEFESNAGPESASESWYCPRCGTGGGHIYY